MSSPEKVAKSRRLAKQPAGRMGNSASFVPGRRPLLLFIALDWRHYCCHQFLHIWPVIIRIHEEYEKLPFPQSFLSRMCPKQYLFLLLCKQLIIHLNSPRAFNLNIQIRSTDILSVEKCKSGKAISGNLLVNMRIHFMSEIQVSSEPSWSCRHGEGISKHKVYL